MGVRGVSGRGHARHGLFDMAGWRCPEGDASSRWLIDIRTDLSPTRSPTTAQARREDPLAELARLIGTSGPAGAAAKPAPHPLQSRAKRPRPPAVHDPPEEVDSAPPSPPSWMQRAPRRCTAAAAACRRTTTTSRNTSRRRCIRCNLASLRAQQPQAPAQDYYEQPQYTPSSSRRRATQQDPSRYDDALYGRLETGEQDYQRDPAYPDDPYAYQGDYEEEEPAPKKRSSGLMTVAAVLALAVVGTGAAFAYRTFVGSPRSGEPPIIRADNSPTKVVPAQSGRRLQEPRPLAVGRRRRKRRAKRRRPTSIPVRRAARGVSAAEPERQPAAGCRAYLRRRRWRRPPTARCRTTSRAGSGRSPSRAIRPRTAASRQAPRPPHDRA